MKFGNLADAKYGVTVYGWNINDIYYFENHRKAKKFFGSIIGSRKWDKGTIISIYDLVNDVKKDWIRF